MNNISNNLHNIFDNVMDTYAKCLCTIFEYNFEDCFWVSNDRTDCFALADSGYFISMNDVITIVDNNIDYDTFVEYDYYNRCVNYAKLNHPDKEKEYYFIKLISWINDCPKQLSKEEMIKEEKLYWDNLRINEKM